jgi:hypothetical protein
MAFCCTAGLLVVGQMMDEEMTERIGPKGRHLPDRVGTRNGTAAGFAVLGGRSVPIRRPRATEVGGGEVHLDSYEVFSATDLMTEMAVERMLAGVSTAVTVSWPSRSARRSKKLPGATRSRPSPDAL